jgi:predicted nuclease of predicted toxin-antitoxin system
MPTTPNWAFLIDENLTKKLAKEFVAAGYRATSVQRDHPELISKADRSIFRMACANGQAIITRDTDFLNSGDFPLPHSGIIVIRMPGKISNAEIARAILAALVTLAGQDLSNHVYELRLDGVHQIS